MAFERKKFEYDYASLEPFIDAQTMQIHSEKHHQGYTDKLNTALEGTEWESKSIEDILQNLDDLPADKQSAVQNNGGGFVNHNLFFSILSPEATKTPQDELEIAINDEFGSFEEFKEKFNQTAASQFGSGWAWLVVTEDGDLDVYSTSNQDSPIMQGHMPVIGLDVWEHAYYLNYQNKRQEYIEAFWNILDWNKVSKLYSSYKK